MKNLTTLLSCLVLLIGTTGLAQTDSTSTDRPTRSDISIRVGGEEGARVEVQTYDSISGEKQDTTTFTIGDSKIIIVDNDEDPDSSDEQTPEEADREKKQAFTHWNGFDFGLNTFIDGDGNYGPGEGNEYLDLNEFNSRYIAFNFAETKLRLIKDYVGVYTGAGVQFYNYKFKNDSTLSFTNDTLIAFKDPTISSIRKNKFRTAWVVVPLMLEFNTSNSESNNFHLAAGVVGGFNIGNMYKQKVTREGGNREKIKSKGELLVEDFKLDAALRIGYKQFALSANYQLTSLFEENKAPELHTASVALAFYFD